ncbi:MAG: hypothetical protein HY828_21800 [Actinobacteria bacterium]|nr:hypothetical protein [Actinomycetota bacterium]
MTIADGPQHERTTMSEAPVAGTAAEVGVPVAHVRTSSSARFAPDALIAAGVGLVLIVIGLIVITRGGFSGSMSDPVVEVLGFRHTTTLGLIEIAIGALLLIAGASRSRALATFGGLVLVVAGFVGAVQTESFATNLALESSVGWWAVVAGAVVVIASLVLPRFARRATTIEQVGPSSVDGRTST